MAVVMDAEALEAFMREVFDQVADDFAVDHVAENEITMRLLTGRRHLRPGGTVSGPSMFALADVAAYLVTLAMIFVAWPFASALLWAVLAAIMFQPLYRSILARFGRRENRAALTTSTNFADARACRPFSFTIFSWRSVFSLMKRLNRQKWSGCQYIYGRRPSPTEPLHLRQGGGISRV